MRRREFMAGLGSSTAVASLAIRPHAVGAQQSGRARRVGVLIPFAEADAEGQARFQAFLRAFADIGWVDGHNISLDVRWAAQDTGEGLGVKITAAGVRDEAAIEPAIAAMAGPDDGGLIVLPDPFNTLTGATTFALAAKYRLPAIYPNRPFVADGGLMSYGTDAWLLFRDSATYIDHILRRVKPGELPVQFPTKFELVINLKTAKALGLTIP
jgi:ABC transporter substrate binding protein